MVDKYLDRAELVLDPCDGRINAGPIGNIERYGKCFAALVGNRLCRVRDPVDAARREGDMCAVRREQQSEMAPKTARCAGHQCDTVLERIYFGHDHRRSEEHTSELQSLMRISYAVFCLKKKKKKTTHTHNTT